MPSRVEDNDPSSISHRQVLINNEQCLVRSFPELSQSLNQKNLDVEKNKRKKINDSVGPRHLDTVLLDTRSVIGGTEYCDAIIYNNNILFPHHSQGSSTEIWSRNTLRVVTARVFYVLMGFLTSPFILNNSVETAAPFNVVSHPRCCEQRN